MTYDWEEFIVLFIGMYCIIGGKDASMWPKVQNLLRKNIKTN
jgi:hypothetical protein